MKLSKATVLLVDDELELLEIFSAWLGRDGCRVLTAANGAEALKVLAVEKIDVLVSDIRMPILDGVGLVRRIYEMGLTIPSIIFVSGFGDLDSREMHSLGVEALLEKPLARKDLLRTLEDSLMEREELWLTPISGPLQESVSIDMGSRDDAMQTQRFELGKGGCCFPCDRPLAEDRTIDLTILFAKEGPRFRVEGEVRWYDPDCALAGVAFRYLDPSCRDWVIASMKARMPRSFIPRGPVCLESAKGSASRVVSYFLRETVT